MGVLALAQGGVHRGQVADIVDALAAGFPLQGVQNAVFDRVSQHQRAEGGFGRTRARRSLVIGVCAEGGLVVRQERAVEVGPPEQKARIDAVGLRVLIRRRPVPPVAGLRDALAFGPQKLLRVLRVAVVDGDVRVGLQGVVIGLARDVGRIGNARFGQRRHARLRPRQSAPGSV